MGPCINVTACDIGRRVIYSQPNRPTYENEIGEVSSFNDNFVFVRFTAGGTAAACRRENLQWESEAPDGTNYLDRANGLYVLKGFVSKPPCQPALSKASPSEGGEA